MNRFVGGRVSIGVPTRNRAVLLRRAVESALSQNYPDIEVVVSDNASTDDTACRIEEIGDPRVVLMRQPTDLGMIGNFNACLRRATGEFFLMLSDDDVLEPGALDRLSAPFRTPPGGLDSRDIGLTWCPCTIASTAGNSLWVSGPGPSVEPSTSLVAGLLDGSRGPRFCGILLRTADALGVGGYDPRHGPVCDIGNWMRVAIRYKWVVCVPEPLARYTMHQTSTTSESTGRQWQQAGENIHDDLMNAIREQGSREGEVLVGKRRTAFLTGLIVTVLMQKAGGPGWARYVLKELVRAPRYMLNRHVASRLARDGWKLIRLGKR